jgi:hypothetical protein
VNQHLFDTRAVHRRRRADHAESGRRFRIRVTALLLLLIAILMRIP